MNDDDRLTPEERNLIEAALALHDARGLEVVACEKKLVHAVDDYRKATARPEPFEGYVHRWGSTWDDAIYDRIPDPDSSGDGQLWRCTVTPIERVRR